MRDRSAPAFLITIDGNQLEKDITEQISRFVFEDCDDKDDLLELYLTGGIDLADNPFFQEGNVIRARWGYVSEWSGIKECILKEPEYDFAETVRLKLKAYDAGSLMKGKDNQKIWKEKTHSQIATAIAVKYNLETEIAVTTKTIDNEPQGGKSDYVFLQYLAKQNDYQLYIQDNVLHFHKRTLDTTPILTLTYKGREGLLLYFRPKVTTQSSKSKGIETKTIGFDPMTKKVITHKANDSNMTQVVLGKKTLLVDGATGEETYEKEETGKVISTPHQTVDENKAIAEKVKADAQLDQMEAEAKVIGIPNLTAKQIIEIAGVGTKFSGNYYIKKVRHEIGPDGYFSTLELQRNAIGKVDDSDEPVTVKTADSTGKENKLHGDDDTEERTITVNPESGDEG